MPVGYADGEGVADLISPIAAKAGADIMAISIANRTIFILFSLKPNLCNHRYSHCVDIQSGPDFNKQNWGSVDYL
jgi:hypothetical protein